MRSCDHCTKKIPDTAEAFKVGQSLACSLACAYSLRKVAQEERND